MKNGHELRKQSVRWCGYICCALLLLAALPAYAQSTGALSPTSAGTLTLFNGGGAWVPTVGTLISDVSTSDNNFATALDLAGTPADVLFMSFPISIPGGATVDGVELRVEGYGGPTAADPVWDGYASIDGGATFPFQAGPLISISAQTLPDAIDAVGGPINTWGGITTADVNSGSFRIGVLAGDMGFAALDTYFIDHVTCEVFYTVTLPSTTNWGLVTLLTALPFAGVFALYRMRRRLHA